MTVPHFVVPHFAHFGPEGLLVREAFSFGRLRTRVSDRGSVVADQEDHLMAQILELAELLERDEVPNVQVRARWVDAQVDAQGTTKFQLRAELISHLVLEALAARDADLPLGSFVGKTGATHQARQLLVHGEFLVSQWGLLSLIYSSNVPRR